MDQRGLYKPWQEAAEKMGENLNRKRLAAAVRKAGLWSGEHDIRTMSRIEDPVHRCLHCGNYGQGNPATLFAAPCPGPDHWPVEVLWQVAVRRWPNFHVAATDKPGWVWIYKDFKDLETCYELVEMAPLPEALEAAILMEVE